MAAAMEAKPGDLLFFAAGKDKMVFDVLGNLRLELARQLGLLDKKDFKFLWVTEFPLLEYSEEENRYVAMHHPFTMPMEEDLPLLDTDPGAVRAKAYDIVLNGTELAAVQCESTRRTSEKRCLRFLDLLRSGRRSSSASCWRPSSTEFRPTRDWPTVWIA